MPRWLGRGPAMFQLKLGEWLPGFRVTASGVRSMPSGAVAGPMGPRSECGVAFAGLPGPDIVVVSCLGKRIRVS